MLRSPGLVQTTLCPLERTGAVSRTDEDSDRRRCSVWAPSPSRTSASYPASPTPACLLGSPVMWGTPEPG